MGMREKTWRRGVIEKMEGHTVSGSGAARKPAVTVSDVYRDANNGIGMLFKALIGFFAGDKAASKIRVGSSGGRRGQRVRKSQRKGFF